jgi:peptidoglycan/LPS O-acetylase OafA/YrhL
LQETPIGRPQGSPEGRVFHTLDLLRGIAAIGVLAFHVQIVFAPISAPSGYLAVDLFFLISGVVLSHAYEHRFRAGMGTLDFMRARIIRLYPLYALGTLLGIAVTLASWLGRNSQHWEPETISRAALQAVFILPNFSSKPVDELFPLNIPCWSLFFELLVNVAFAAAWPLLASRRLVVVCLLTGCAIILTIWHQGNINLGSTGSSLAVGMARTAFGFFAGVLISRRLRNSRRSESNFAVLAIAAIVGLALFASPAGEFRAIWDAMCVLVVFPLIVCCGMLVDPRRWLKGAALFLGTTSYAVYVLHSPLSAVLNSVLPIRSDVAEQPRVAAPYSLLPLLVVLVTGCWLVDRYFDAPVRRQLSRLVPKAAWGPRRF